MAHTAMAKVFLDIPWAAAYLTEPNTELRVNESRTKKPSNEDSLFGGTFNTSDTIPAAIAFYTTPSATDTQINQVSAFFKIGTGLDGWPQIMHGGIVATIIDEAMGFMIWTNINYHRQNPGRNPEGPAKNMSVVGGGSLTAELKTTYKSPVRTPGIILATSRYVRREGRKDWVVTEIYQYDDAAQKQVLCAVGEALFIAKRAAL